MMLSQKINYVIHLHFIYTVIKKEKIKHGKVFVCLPTFVILMEQMLMEQMLVYDWSDVRHRRQCLPQEVLDQDIKAR